jgi:hypothetical protein
LSNVAEGERDSDPRLSLLAHTVMFCIRSLKATVARCNPDAGEQLQECMVWGREMQRIAIAQYNATKRIREFYGNFYDFGGESLGVTGKASVGWDVLKVFRENPYRVYSDVVFGDGDFERFRRGGKSDDEFFHGVPGGEFGRHSEDGDESIPSPGAAEPAKGASPASTGSEKGSPASTGSGKSSSPASAGAAEEASKLPDHQWIVRGYHPGRRVMMEPFPVVHRPLLVKLINDQREGVKRAQRLFDQAEQEARDMEREATDDIDISALKEVGDAEKRARRARDAETLATRRFMAIKDVTSIVKDSDDRREIERKRRKFWADAIASEKKSSKLLDELVNLVRARPDDMALRKTLRARNSACVMEVSSHRLINQIFLEVILTMESDEGKDRAGSAGADAGDGVDRAAAAAIDAAVARIDSVASWGESLIRLSRL